MKALVLVIALSLASALNAGKLLQWEAYKSDRSSAELQSLGEKAIRFKWSLDHEDGKSHCWAGIEAPLSYGAEVDYRAAQSIRFMARGDGEVKFAVYTGENWGENRAFCSSIRLTRDWKQIVIPISGLERCWEDPKVLEMGRLVALGIHAPGNPGARGWLDIGELSFVGTGGELPDPASFHRDLFGWGINDPRYQGYNIYLSIKGKDTFRKINAQPVTGKRYPVKDLVRGLEYQWVLTAINPEGVETQPSPRITFKAE